MPLLQQHGDKPKRVGIVLVTGDRGLAGSFNSQIIRAGLKLGAETSRATAWRSTTTSSAAAAPRR